MARRPQTTTRILQIELRVLTTVLTRLIFPHVNTGPGQFPQPTECASSARMNIHDPGNQNYAVHFTQPAILPAA